MLIIYRYFLTPFFRAVIVICTDFFEVRFECFILYPCIKIQDHGPAFIYQLACLDKPVAKPFLRRLRRRENIFQCMEHGSVRQFGAKISRTVKITVFFIVNIRVYRSSHVHEEIVFCPVRRTAECKTILFTCFTDLTGNIPARSHLRRIPAVKVRCIHRKTVVVFTHWHDIFSTGFLKEVYPFVCVKLLTLEHRDEILVSEILGITEMFLMEFIFARTGIIHPSRIPFARICRNAVDSPVNEDSEFCLVIPGRCFVIRQRGPIGFISSLFDHFVDQLQILFVIHGKTSYIT